MLTLARIPSPNFLLRGSFQYLLPSRSGGAGDQNKCAAGKIISLRPSMCTGTAEAGTITRCEVIAMVTDATFCRRKGRIGLSLTTTWTAVSNTNMAVADAAIRRCQQRRHLRPTVFTAAPNTIVTVANIEIRIIAILTPVPRTEMATLIPAATMKLETKNGKCSCLYMFFLPLLLVFLTLLTFFFFCRLTLMPISILRQRGQG